MFGFSSIPVRRIEVALQHKWSFSKRILSVNVTKSTGNYRFNLIYDEILNRKSHFCAVQLFLISEPLPPSHVWCNPSPTSPRKLKFLNKICQSLETAAPRSSVENFAKFERKHMYFSLFFHKFKSCWFAALLKRGSREAVFSWIWRMF